MREIYLGISAYYHDSAAALIIDGAITAAAHEERFNRKKHFPGFPEKAVRYVLREAGITLGDVKAVVFYDKPFIKFERLLETYHGFAPWGLSSFLSAIPVWIREKMFMKSMLKKELRKIDDFHGKITLLFPDHHLSHAASAFYPSNFKDAAILTIDGVGEWATSTIAYGTDNRIKILKELDFPHSVGLLYSAFTYYTGFKVNSGEYKLMGLAPYGHKNSKRTKDYKQRILTELIDLRHDGSLVLNMKYFKFATGLRMTHDKKWEKLFGLPPRSPETEISQPYMDMALAIQEVTEEIILRMARTAKKITQSANLVMAGGVALNSVANGKIIREEIFENVWVQPAAGDAGGALGAALAAWHIWKGHERNPESPDSMGGAYLGPKFSDKEIKKTLDRFNVKYSYYDNFNKLTELTANKIANGNVIGWFQGRMEYGPRALGNRSILGDARNPEMQKKMNLKIKFREGFRPFAPTVLEEDIPEYFELDRPSPYMLLVVPVKPSRCNPYPEGFEEKALSERLYFKRSDIPAVTHVDYSARLQSVNKETNPKYWQLINNFKALTGYGIVVNTSFNVRGEPIVCTPEDGFRCFMRTEMDHLVMGNFFIDKHGQEPLKEDIDWKEEFKPD